MTDPTPGAPVPPDDLIVDWLDEHVKATEGVGSHHQYVAHKAAAWGYAQAMRKGRAAELRAIADAVENLDPPECPVSHLGSIEYPSGFDHGAQAGLYAVVAWLRVAAVKAESGGSSDG